MCEAHVKSIRRRSGRCSTCPPAFVSRGELNAPSARESAGAGPSSDNGAGPSRDAWTTARGSGKGKGKAREGEGTGTRAPPRGKDVVREDEEWDEDLGGLYV